jgi:hypothetical protein
VVASFQVTVNGNPYVIQTGPFVQDAEPAAEQVLALLQAEDWAGLYGQMYLHFRQSTTQQDFIAMASGATQTEGSVVRYAVVPGFEYSGQPGAGHRAATGYVTVLAAQSTMVTRERSPMTLIREENTWKVVSLDEPESSTTLTTVPVTGTATNATTDPQTGLAEFAFFGQAGQHYSVRVSSATVSEATWEVVQARFDDPERLRMGKRKASYGLAGHIRCSTCGRSIVGQTLQGTYRYYRCRNAFSGPKHDCCQSRYVRADVLESSVKAAVAGVLARPEIVAAELLRQREQIGWARQPAPRNWTSSNESGRAPFSSTDRAKSTTAS